MTDMLFDDMFHEPPSAAELTRRQREAVIDAVWKRPGLGSFRIAEIMGISWPDAWARLMESEANGDVHCQPGWADSGGWFAGPGRDKG